VSEEIPYAGASTTVFVVVSSTPAGKASVVIPKDTTLKSSDH